MVVGQFAEVARASRPWNHAQDARATSKLTHYRNDSPLDLASGLWFDVSPSPA
jgi:hypothetical protein